jgi:hypothetical protein
LAKRRVGTYGKEKVKFIGLDELIANKKKSKRIKKKSKRIVRVITFIMLAIILYSVFGAYLRL